jgi:hypothetical protein
LARKIHDPDFIDIIKQYDVILLSETWISTNTHINLNITGYNCDHLYGNKTSYTRKGRYSGGISIYFKDSLNNFVKIIEKIQNGILWVELDKSLFEFKENVYICHTYIVPNTSTVVNRDDFDFLEQIELSLEKYKLLGKCFITGDLNSRTSNLLEILDFDTYIDENIPDIINIPARVSQDHVIDQAGRRLIEFCMSSALVIGNGRLYSDRDRGEFTYHSLNGSSVVDYFLSNIIYDFHCISVFCVLQPNEFSNHSGISFNIYGNLIHIKTSKNVINNNNRPNWDD